MKIALIALIIIGLWLFYLFIGRALIGYFAPKSYTGKLYIKEALSERGVNPDLLGDDCINELVKNALDAAQMRTRWGVKPNEPIHVTFVRNLEIHAMHASVLFHGDPDDKKDLIESGYATIEILNKYSVPFKNK